MFKLKTLTWPGLVWRRPSVSQSCRWSKVPGCTKSGRSPPEGWSWSLLQLSSCLQCQRCCRNTCLPGFVFLCSSSTHLCFKSAMKSSCRLTCAQKMSFNFERVKKDFQPYLGNCGNQCSTDVLGFKKKKFIFWEREKPGRAQRFHCKWQDLSAPEHCC